MALMFNPQNKGLAKVFRDYQEEAVKFIWEKWASVGALSRYPQAFLRMGLRFKRFTRSLT